MIVNLMQIFLMLKSLLVAGAMSVAWSLWAPNHWWQFPGRMEEGGEFEFDFVILFLSLF